MKFNLDFFEHLRNNIQISQIVSNKVALKRHRNEYQGLCPFHTEKTPSFTVNNQKKFYHCFGCGAHGDIIKFIAETEGVNYSDAAVRIANQFAIPVPQISKQQERLYQEMEELHDILELASKFYINNLNDNVVRYLSERGFSNTIIKKFEIGYAPPGGIQKFLESKKIPIILMQKAGLISASGNGRTEIFRDRIMFPIRNIYKKVIAFGGRVLSSDIKPKYLNSPETLLFNKSETLYAEEKATASIYKKNQAILVEGYVDVLALHQAGFEESVAALGTAVTEQHLVTLWKTADEIIFLMDGDQAGVNASVKAANILLPLLNNDKKASFVMLPDGYDPDDYIKKFGVTELGNLISNKKSLSEFLFNIEYNKKNLKTAEDFADLDFRLSLYVKTLTNPMIAKSYNIFFQDQIWRLRCKKKHQVVKAQKSQLNIQESNSELIQIEYNMMAYLFKYPSLEIIETLSNVQLRSIDLVQIKDIILASYLENQLKGDNLSYKIKDLIEKSGFFDAYRLLCNIEFLKNTDANFWHIMQKKHHLALLKIECEELTNILDEKTFLVLKEYRNQILALEEEIKDLTN